MKSVMVPMLLAAALLALLLAACGGSDEQAGAEDSGGETRMEETAGTVSPADRIRANCVKCHDLKRVCENIGVKDPQEWGQTISLMIRKGAKLDSTYMLGVSAFLATEPDAARAALCE